MLAAFFSFKSLKNSPEYSGIKAAISSGAKYVVAIPDKRQIKDVENISYDKNKTKLIILNSMDEFDISLINKDKNL